MKNLLLFVLLFISVRAFTQINTHSFPQNTSNEDKIFNMRNSNNHVLNNYDTIPSDDSTEKYYASQLSLEFRKNNDTNCFKSRKLNIKEDDIITVILKNVFIEDASNYSLKQISVKDLSSAIKFGKIDIPTNRNNVSKITPTTVDIIFVIANLEQGKSFKFLVINNEIIEDQFYVDVNEIIHFEINIGPVFSSLPNSDFKSFTASRDVSGNEDSVLIKDNGTNYQLNFVLDGVFHPWGYDPRAKFSLRNIFILLGIPLDKTLGENFLLGCGFGARGLNLVAGLHIGIKKRLIDGYNLNTKYSKLDVDMEKIVKKEISFAYFAGLVLDLGIVGKLFSSIKL